MNIDSKFCRIRDIKTFLKSEFNCTTFWKSEESLDQIQQFLNRHLGIIANQKSKTLHKQLMTLSNRINREWNNAQAHNLAFMIMGVAMGILKSKRELPNLPADTWCKILSYIPPCGDQIRKKRGGTPSGLENFFPSKQMLDVAQIQERQWAGKQLVSLKKYGCKTAKEAIAYVINNQLTGANLSEFPDLDERNLELLFEYCPQFNQLSIQSNRIKSLPSKAHTLKSLYCKECEKLQILPMLSEVQILHCSGCVNLQSLPELPQIRELNCSDCPNLQNLPSLSQVQILDCSLCQKLQSLPALPQVQNLDCSWCESLEGLPELPQALMVNCSWCENLEKLPALPQALMLNCSWCENLEKLSALPQARFLNCRWCDKLECLPQLPFGAKILQGW